MVGRLLICEGWLGSESRVGWTMKMKIRVLCGSEGQLCLLTLQKGDFGMYLLLPKLLCSFEPQLQIFMLILEL